MQCTHSPVKRLFWSPALSRSIVPRTLHNLLIYCGIWAPKVLTDSQAPGWRRSWEVATSSFQFHTMHRPSILSQDKRRTNITGIRYGFSYSQSQRLPVSSQQGCSPSWDKENPKHHHRLFFLSLSKIWNTFQFNFCINLQKSHCGRFTTLGYLKFHDITHIGYASFVSLVQWKASEFQSKRKMSSSLSMNAKEKVHTNSQ